MGVVHSDMPELTAYIVRVGEQEVVVATRREALEVERQLVEAERQKEEARRAAMEAQWRLAEAQAQRRKEEEAANHRQRQRQLALEFLGRLGRMELTSPMPDQLREFRHVLIIGDVSVGKSALLSRLLGVQLRVGRGHTTMTIAAAHTDKDRELVVWDSPGMNQELALYDMENLRFLSAMSLVVLAYETSLVTADMALRMAVSLRRPVAVVRTKCDLWKAGTDAASLEEEMQRDAQHLASVPGAEGVRFFRTAAKGSDTFQNAELLALMYGSRVPIGP